MVYGLRFTVYGLEVRGARNSERGRVAGANMAAMLPLPPKLCLSRSKVSRGTPREACRVRTRHVAYERTLCIPPHGAAFWQKGRERSSLLRERGREREREIGATREYAHTNTIYTCAAPRKGLRQDPGAVRVILCEQPFYTFAFACKTHFTGEGLR